MFELLEQLNDYKQFVIVFSCIVYAFEQYLK